MDVCSGRQEVIDGSYLTTCLGSIIYFNAMRSRELKVTMTRWDGGDDEIFGTGTKPGTATYGTNGHTCITKCILASDEQAEWHRAEAEICDSPAASNPVMVGVIAALLPSGGRTQAERRRQREKAQCTILLIEIPWHGLLYCSSLAIDCLPRGKQWAQLRNPELNGCIAPAYPTWYFVFVLSPNIGQDLQYSDFYSLHSAHFERVIPALLLSPSLPSLL
ncbi:hypothetical protein ACRALDRAFT_208007 [Sodiomyces alcalophilus JCM 7366]|uniref:uncharacterized protein n=1 Tax=Sodiomyces alcalophilus JCM 7366 TaxID=591952 RepID=UPI0039B63269